MQKQRARKREKSSNPLEQQNIPLCMISTYRQRERSQDRRRQKRYKAGVST